MITIITIIIILIMIKKPQAAQQPEAPDEVPGGHRVDRPGLNENMYSVHKSIN